MGDVASWMTGSMRMRAERRRGWMRDSWVLDVRVSDGGVCKEDWGFLQMVSTHAVAYAYKRSGHLCAEVVDHVEEISGVVVPRGLFWRLAVRTEERTSIAEGPTIIAQFVFVEDTTPSLSSHVCNPYALDGLPPVFHYLI